MNYKLKKISGDASFREFYRLQKGKKTSIIVQARREKFKNLITYCVVNKILTNHKIYAPKLIQNYYCSWIRYHRMVKDLIFQFFV